MPQLLERLVLEFPDSSKSTLKKWIKAGRIRVDGQKALEPHQEVSEQALIRLMDKQKFLNLDIEVLYEDRDLIVVNKPEGILSVATAFETEETVHGVLKKEFRRVFPVHRLDRETSGVMVMALSDIAREGLKEQFHTHSIHREYRAIVRGKIEGSGTWKCRLLEDANYFVRPHPKGDLAITHYTVLNNRGKTTALQLILETGKKNQIRAQALAAGYPILGDQKYGDTSSGRLHLHAYALDFIHPVTHKKMSFKSPVPFET
ncbi:MAG: RluA family pseudouridine synthase [Chlamydiales bacterium]|nr:RluA family pseudouridine synthase [Chlamydiales bacterium]